MSTVKILRAKAGLTQSALAEKANLSLRTIQRLEASHKAPKGHTLTVLAGVFNVEPSELHNELQAARQTKASEQLSIKLINLSAFAFFLFPFGNIVLPLIVWRKRNKSQEIDHAARIIINFQILWTVVLCTSLSISPFIGTGTLSSFPLILLVLFIALGVNLIVIVLSAHWIQNDKIQFLKLPIRLL